MSQARPNAGPLVIDGWSIYAHPLFLIQVEELIVEVEDRKARDPSGYVSKNCTKRLAAIHKLVTETIPADPASPQFRQGGTLGGSRKHWFRAKFYQRYRMFFRYDGNRKVIVLGWVNDDSTLRTFSSKTDAYTTFKSMLDEGNPPDDFETLFKEAAAASSRFKAAMERTQTP